MFLNEGQCKLLVSLASLNSNVTMFDTCFPLCNGKRLLQDQVDLKPHVFLILEVVDEGRYSCCLGVFIFPCERTCDEV